MEPARQHFRTEPDCLLCCLNFCIGVSNVATFPYLVYHNGGLVFLVVYVMLLCIVSVPMVYLELFLGQFCGWSVPKAFEGFPMARGLGWTMLFGDILLVLLHIHVVAYSWMYMTASVSPVLPWSVCHERDAEHRSCYTKEPGRRLCSMVNETLARQYLSKNYTGDRVITVRAARSRLPVNVPISEYEAMRNSCIEGNVSAARAFYERRVTDDQHGPSSVNQLDSTTSLAMIVAWTLVFLAVMVGVRSIRKASVIMLVTRLCTLSLLCIASCMLSGARQGLLLFLWPDLTKLYSGKTWLLAFRHMLYSVGLSLGAMTFFASYNNFCWPVLG